MKIIFAGTPNFALPALKALLASSHQICAVYTKPDKPAGRGLKLTTSPIKQLARTAGLKICQPPSLKDADAQKELGAFNADVFVDVAYGMILPPAVLALPPRGCLNIHPSLLPRWRGAAPLQRAIQAGDNVTGVTIMLLDEGLDTGPILQQREFSLTTDETTATLEPKLAALGAELLIDTLNKLQNSVLVPTPQIENGTTYASKISKEEAKIDWNDSAINIERKIRAFNPWPIADATISSTERTTLKTRVTAPSTAEKNALHKATIFPPVSTLNNQLPSNEQIVRIFQAVAINSCCFKKPNSPLCLQSAIASTIAPGTILSASSAGVDLITGDGILRLLKIQLPGGRPQDIKEILNGHRKLFMPGNRFL